MSRDLTSTMQSGLASRVVRPVLIGRLDILGDAVNAWTGPGLFAPSGTGDSALDGQTFSPAAAFVSLSAVTEDQSTGGPVTVTARRSRGHDGHGLSARIFRAARSGRFAERDAATGKAGDAE